ncbi:MAG: aminotransferase class V-fold PLP-dependent enzyme [Proteobacteria bacterium]|nr:aminotransferase class V-fold PLP-dependent enzyme [Pseudomonadota bacterium]MBU1596788.1 aminotransferase class V-fold PLP-dependent enzyme [Pseudomonadota bacterium]
MAHAPCFASDNYAGVHPTVMAALAAANVGPAPAYGADALTRAACARFKEVLGENAEPFFVFLGTAANVLALQAMTRPHHAVLAASSAHINVDECGAPERILGCKLMCVDTAGGKLTPGDLRPFLSHLGNEHHNQPRVVSIAQATELGTVYGIDEIQALADFAHENGLLLHMDGARLGNAAAALGCDLRDLTSSAGVDALSFGGTKNGLMFGEAVVFFRPDLARDFPFIRKQGMQLCSKMRFIAAQFLALLDGGLWRANAAQANAMARLLADKVAGIPGLRLTQPVETNAVFASLAPRAIARLQERFAFYVWDHERHVVRWMTSFATTEAEVEAFAAAVRQEVAAAEAGAEA